MVLRLVLCLFLALCTHGYNNGYGNVRGTSYTEILSDLWTFLVDLFTQSAWGTLFNAVQESKRIPTTTKPATTRVPKIRPSAPWWASANGIVTAKPKNKWRKVAVVRKKKKKPMHIPIIRRHRSTTTIATTTIAPIVAFTHPHVHQPVHKPFHKPVNKPVHHNAHHNVPSDHLHDDYFYSDKFSRLTNILNIVRFKNEICQAYDRRNGTCYHALECKSYKGIAAGKCAKGFGVCCVFEKSCGDAIKHNCSYFVSPKSFNNTYICSIVIHKINPHVNHIRLDFANFELQSPTNGSCMIDQFIVSGQNVNSIVPVICGSNTGSHIYIDSDSNPGPLRLTVMANPDMTPRSWRIKVTQFDIWRPSGVPQHCLQSYSGIVGMVQSFNYRLNGDQNYLNNLNYAICIRKERGFCSITYANVDNQGFSYPFQIVNRDEMGMPNIPPGQAGIGVRDCPDDFIIINGIRLCGDILNDASTGASFDQNAPVTDLSQGPFVIPVRTNGMDTGAGFKLFYKQNPCMTQMLG